MALATQLKAVHRDLALLSKDIKVTRQEQKVLELILDELHSVQSSSPRIYASMGKAFVRRPSVHSAINTLQPSSIEHSSNLEAFETKMACLDAKRAQLQEQMDDLVSIHAKSS